MACLKNQRFFPRLISFRRACTPPQAGFAVLLRVTARYKERDIDVLWRVAA